MFLLLSFGCEEGILSAPRAQADRYVIISTPCLVLVLGSGGRWWVERDWLMEAYLNEGRDAYEKVFRNTEFVVS